MLAPRVLLAAALLVGLTPAAQAVPAVPESFHTRDGLLFVDNLALVDRAFDAGSFKAAKDAYLGPRRSTQGETTTTQRTHVFADATLRISSFYESTTYELYPHRPLERGAAFKFAAPMLANSPFAKGLPAKPARSKPRQVEWEAESGASYTLTYALDGAGRVVKITLDWGV